MINILKLHYTKQHTQYLLKKQNIKQLEVQGVLCPSF